LLARLERMAFPDLKVKSSVQDQASKSYSNWMLTLGAPGFKGDKGESAIAPVISGMTPKPFI
jgi:hypothetical protein